MECKSNGQHTNRTLCRSFAKIMRVTPNQRNTCKTSKTGYVFQNVGDERAERGPKRPRGTSGLGSGVYSTPGCTPCEKPRRADLSEYGFRC